MTTNTDHDCLVLTREIDGRRYWWAKCECSWSFGGSEHKSIAINKWNGHRRLYTGDDDA